MRPGTEGIIIVWTEKTKEREELHQQVTAPRRVIYIMLTQKMKMWLQGTSGSFCPSREGQSRKQCQYYFFEGIGGTSSVSL